MITELLVILFYSSAMIGLVFTLLSMLFANIYDIKAAKRARHQRQHPYAKWRRYRPLVSIIIAARNEEAAIERCLASITASYYRHYEVTVVNDGSTDRTADIVSQFIATHPTKTIRLINRKQNGGKGAAITTGYRRYGRGELVMTLDADCVIERSTLSRAVRHFANPEIAALAPNARVMSTPTILGILQRFEFLIGFRTKKFYSAANCEYIIGGAGAVYRKSVFGKVRRFAADMQTEDIAISLAIARLGNKVHRLQYASDVIVWIEPAPTYKSLFWQRYRWKIGALQAIYANRVMVFNPSRRYSKMLSWFRLPLVLWSEFLLLMELVFFSFFMVNAIRNHNPALYVGAYITLMIIMLITIWDDDQFNLDDRISLTLAAPALYPLFFIMTSIQVGAAVRCLFNIPVITRARMVDGRWVSPPRQGKPPVEPRLTSPAGA